MSKRNSMVAGNKTAGQTRLRADIARMYERMMNTWRGFGGDDPLAPMNNGVPCPLWQDAAQAVMGKPFLPEKPTRQAEKPYAPASQQSIARLRALLEQHKGHRTC